MTLSKDTAAKMIEQEGISDEVRVGLKAMPDRQGPLYIDIVLDTTLEDIPEGPTCLVCDFPTEKALLEYTCGTSVIQVRAEQTPGYRCSNSVDECDFECLSHEALLEALTKAKDIMLESGDEDTAEAFREGIDLERRIIKGEHFMGSK